MGKFNSWGFPHSIYSNLRASHRQENKPKHKLYQNTLNTLGSRERTITPVFNMTTIFDRKIQVVNNFFCPLTKFSEQEFIRFFCSNNILTTKSSDYRHLQQNNQRQTQPHHSHKLLQNSKAAQRHHGPE